MTDEQKTQIALEAARDILEIPVINEYMLPEMSAIIQAAIEKARLLGYDEGFRDGALAANRPEYRAAQGND